MKRYKIMMKTPVGLRYGTMEVRVSCEQVEGSFDLLGHKNPFTGTMKDDGSCTLSGQLMTLMRNVHFTAEGKITGQEVELSLKGERNIFQITGTAEKSEENNHA